MPHRTRYALYDEEEAADWLAMDVQQFRKINRSKGPRSMKLPTGEIRYRLEDLEDWAFSVNPEVLNIYDPCRARVIAFPNSGITVRRHLRRAPVDRSDRKPWGYWTRGRGRDDAS